jgi:hypothetical protein
LKIVDQIEQARSLLEPWGLQDALVVYETVDPDKLVERPSWDANNPPVSRRDFFRAIAGLGQAAKLHWLWRMRQCLPVESYHDKFCFILRGGLWRSGEAHP